MSPCLYIHIHIHTYIYIYIYIFRSRSAGSTGNPRAAPPAAAPPAAARMGPKKQDKAAAVPAAKAVAAKAVAAEGSAAAPPSAAEPKKPAAVPAAKAVAAKAVAAEGSAGTPQAKDAMNRAEVSKMLGLLKYRADDAKNKKGVDAPEARAALEAYQKMDTLEKRQFLADFLANGAGKKPGSLKFVVGYTQKLTRQQTEEVSTTEDFLTLPKILELHGLKWADFPADQALEIGLQLVEDNKTDFSHDGEVLKHAKMSILDRYRFIHSAGLTKRRKKEHSEELSKEASDAAKITTMCESGALAIPGPSNALASSAPPIKQEIPGVDKAKEKLALLRTALTAVQKNVGLLVPLQKRFAFSGKKDDLYAKLSDEVKTKMDGLDKFIDDAQTLIVEAECTEEAEFPSLLPRLTSAAAACEAHAIGSKDMLAKYKNMAR